MRKKEILPDGSIKEESFSKNYKGEYPSPNKYETYRQYRARVNKCVEKGFHLGDLSWQDWGFFCMGSGHYEGVDSDEMIYKTN